MDFYITRIARDFYQFDPAFFAGEGEHIFSSMLAVRKFAFQINHKHHQSGKTQPDVTSGEVNAMAVLIEVYHALFRWYLDNFDTDLLHKQWNHWISGIGEENLEQYIHSFLDHYPPLKIYLEQISHHDFLRQQKGGVTQRQKLTEEILILWVIQQNPAMLETFPAFFHDPDFQATQPARIIDHAIPSFLGQQPKTESTHQTLLEMLLAPAKASPHSLRGQLEYVLKHWNLIIPSLFNLLLSSLDTLQEEKRLFSFSGPPAVPDFNIPYFDSSAAENFSRDENWMDNLVLMAKNAFVWLDQLSKKYRQPITHLDQIPDQELDNLASWGFTGLWLIGLWQRSQASARIKQICGNPEALASAYSLYDYVIAPDLGGEPAYQTLKARAFQRGIRMASDLVPNHMGIDSPWVMERPDWFISLPYSPYPNYTFQGPNLSGNDHIGVYIEDHYFTRSDAAVVFKREDFRTGDTRYIYHGNDGTSMPWNDTAQLNYLIPEVREQVIQTILKVARLSPVIRFDAAMTLTKEHYQRLWYPKPGSGGDIPTRAEHGISKEEFNRLFPVEFWKEVVDRIAAEAPDTLLMAEAFWLMENYFVRSLGMHRVYNSAFMHLMRDENNEKYRSILKASLEFSPEIFKRYVNFMNNPDEQTAVAQFGKGDKYFGICTLLATLPGLPMFGHGQLEGNAEKYGMEYRKAYIDEPVDTDLMERHRREIFPLLRRRAQFTGIRNFLMYDFFTSPDSINQNVFACSNQVNGQASLVLYNNAYPSTQGRVHISAQYKDTSRPSEEGFRQKTLAEGLNLCPGQNQFLICRNHTSGLMHITPLDEVIQTGMHFHLNGYQTIVLLDFEVRTDDDHRHLKELCRQLNGAGVADINQALISLRFRPLQDALRQLINPGYFDFLNSQTANTTAKHFSLHINPEAQQKMQAVLEQTARLTGKTLNQEMILAELEQQMRWILSGKLLELTDEPWNKPWLHLRRFLQTTLTADSAYTIIQWSWLFLQFLEQLNKNTEQKHDWIQELNLQPVLQEACQNMGLNHTRTESLITLLKILISHPEDLLNLSESQLQHWADELFQQTTIHIGDFYGNEPAGAENTRNSRLALMAWFLWISALKVFSNQNSSVTCQYEQTLKLLMISQTLTDGMKD